MVSRSLPNDPNDPFIQAHSPRILEFAPRDRAIGIDFIIQFILTKLFAIFNYLNIDALWRRDTRLATEAVPNISS